MKLDSFEPKSRRIRLRAIVPEDEAFLLDVYRNTRAEELVAYGWSEEQLTPFLRMQLNARTQSYLMYYTGLHDSIIVVDEAPVGRMILSRTDEEVRLVDIALLPDARSAGIGTAVISDLIAEADRDNKAFRLQVEKTNPQALTLYARLGFAVTSETQTHIQMERSSI